MVEVRGVAAVGVDTFLTAIHFSFPSLIDLLFSSSEVMLSSVSASTPVVFSDSELDADEVVSDGVASPDMVAAGVVSVDEVNMAVEGSLFAMPPT